MSTSFRIGPAPDFATEGVGLLDAILPAQFGALPWIACETLPDRGPVIAAGQLAGYDGDFFVYLDALSRAVADVRKLQGA